MLAVLQGVRIQCQRPSQLRKDQNLPKFAIGVSLETFRAGQETGGEVEEPSTPRRGRSRSPDQADVQHADILGHVDQLKHAGLLISPLLHPACMFQPLSAARIYLWWTLWHDAISVILVMLRPVGASKLHLASSRHATWKWFGESSYISIARVSETVDLEMASWPCNPDLVLSWSAEIDEALLTKEEQVLLGRKLPALGRPSDELRRRAPLLKPIAERDESEADNLRARLRSM